MLVSRRGLVQVHQLRVFAVEADRLAAICRQRFIEIAELAKEEFSDARTHVDLVRHRCRQRMRPRSDAGIKRDVNRHVAPPHDFLLGGVGGIVDRRDMVVRHVGDMHDAAMHGCSRGG